MAASVIQNGVRPVADLLQGLCGAEILETHPQVDLLKALSSDCGRLHREIEEISKEVTSLREEQQSLHAQNKRLRESCVCMEAEYQALDSDCKKVRKIKQTLQ